MNLYQNLCSRAYYKVMRLNIKMKKELDCWVGICNEDHKDKKCGGPLVDREDGRVAVFPDKKSANKFKKIIDCDITKAKLVYDH